MKKGLGVLAAISAIVLSVAFLAGLSRRLQPRHVWSGSAVGLLRVEGIITDAEWHVEKIKDFRKNPRIKAVVLRVDSPGGGVAASQELFEELGKLAEEKPLVTSMGTVAASGGYYVACASDWIVANPGTITGSIGVIISFTNWQGLMDKIGLSNKAVKSGKFKDTGSPFRPMTEEEERLVHDMVMDTYRQFEEAVLKKRPVKKETAEKYFDGRVLTGRQALEIGLVDELGDLEDAVSKAGELGRIPDKPPKVVEARPEERGGLFTLFMGKNPEEFLLSLTGVGSGKNAREFQLWRAF